MVLNVGLRIIPSFVCKIVTASFCLAQRLDLSDYEGTPNCLSIDSSILSSNDKRFSHIRRCTKVIIISRNETTVICRQLVIILRIVLTAFQFNALSVSAVFALNSLPHARFRNSTHYSNPFFTRFDILRFCRIFPTLFFSILAKPPLEFL